MPLSVRALNRALLARQLLLERRSMAAFDAVEHLVGLQAQVPSSPYLSLWSRLAGFEPAELSELVAARRAVRLALMRSTIHLVTGRDCLSLRPALQTVQDAALRRSPFLRALPGLDVEAVVAVARILVEAEPLTLAALGARLRQRWPDRDGPSMAQVIRTRLALVQVPPRGLWHASGLPRCTTAEAWLGRPLDLPPPLEDVVIRYLRAFGPAAVADMQAWSGLTGLRTVFERLRPRLRSDRDERGRELFDLPDAPLPDATTPAPPRFLPDYDNVLLGHADRSRIIPPTYPHGLASIGRPALLVDGFVTGTWALERHGGGATLRIDLATAVDRTARSAVADEGARLLDLLTPEAGSREVRLVEPL